MPVRHPRTGAVIINEETKEPVTITVLGKNSATARAVTRVVQERNSDKVSRGFKFTDDDMLRDNAEILAACTVAWTFEKMDGEDYPCNQQNAYKLYSDRRMKTVYEQVLNFWSDSGNYVAD